MRRLQEIVAAVVITGMIVLAINLLLSSCKKNNPRERSDEEKAYNACMSLVYSNLKAPGSAKWPLFDEPGVQIVNSTEKHGFVINTYVDAQNSFGAFIRAQVSCVVQYAGDDKWKVVQWKVQ